MADPRHLLGAAGEDIAARFLAQHAYVILERNRRSEGGEIDIVARDPDGIIVFVEVRTRRGADAAAHALESVNAAKQQRLLAGAAPTLPITPIPVAPNRPPGSTSSPSPPAATAASPSHGTSATLSTPEASPAPRANGRNLR